RHSRGCPYDRLQKLLADLDAAKRPHIRSNREPSMIEIPARQGKALRLRRGQRARVVNTKGQQVVDTWAFNDADLKEFMSMEHSRVAIGHIIPAVGDTLVTKRRRPILTLVEDNSGGIHDTLFAACDRWRYELLGAEGYHDNCTDNLAAGMKALR